MGTPQENLDNFAQQAQWCRVLESPFTSLLCEVLAEHLDGATGVGKAVLDWPGKPAADALALRLVGALHAQVRSGGAPQLAQLYPPQPLPPPSQLWQAVLATLQQRGDEILRMMQGPPQTNEVARAATLLGGFLTVAQRTHPDLELLELGASAGLNMNWDSFHYSLAGATWGDAASQVQLAPRWTGPPPPLDTPLRAVRRLGCDRAPLSASNTEDRERLCAYIWPDHPHRMERLRGALQLAQSLGTEVERTDAADFVDRELGIPPTPGRTRVFYHTVVWQYLPRATRARIRRSIEAAGEAATPDAPLAWLSLEAGPRDITGGLLRLRLWPGGEGEEEWLARAELQGRWVEWGEPDAGGAG